MIKETPRRDAAYALGITLSCSPSLAPVPLDWAQWAPRALMDDIGAL